MCTSRLTTVTRRPGTGRMPKARTTATWLWPPPISSSSRLRGSGGWGAWACISGATLAAGGAPINVRRASAARMPRSHFGGCSPDGPGPLRGTVFPARDRHRVLVGSRARQRHLPPERQHQQPELRHPQHVDQAARPRYRRPGVHAGRTALGHCAASTPSRRGRGCWRCCCTTSAITGSIASATSARCSGPRTWCITRARSSTSPRRCARPAPAFSRAGCSTSRASSRACRLPCSSRWPRRT